MKIIKSAHSQGPGKTMGSCFQCGVTSDFLRNALVPCKALHPQLSIVRTGSQKDRNETSSAGKIGLQRVCSDMLYSLAHRQYTAEQISTFQTDPEHYKNLLQNNNFAVFFSPWKNCSFKNRYTQ